jgi:hypothetical protein
MIPMTSCTFVLIVVKDAHKNDNAESSSIFTINEDKSEKQITEVYARKTTF